MTKIFLLDALKAFTEEATKDLLMPVRMQKDDKEQPLPRAPDVYKMRLIKSSDAQKVAPYIIHGIITGRDSQTPNNRATGQTVVRSVFCVYNEDEQEGSLMLLNLMERYRIALLEKIMLEDRYQLDMEDGLDLIIYPDDTAPYYAGEMVGTWIMPAVTRKVKEYVY